MKKRLMSIIVLIGALFPTVSIDAAQSGLIVRGMQSISQKAVSISRDLSNIHNDLLVKQAKLRKEGSCTCDKNIPSIEKCRFEQLQDEIVKLAQEQVRLEKEQADHTASLTSSAYWVQVGIIAIPTTLLLGNILWNFYKNKNQHNINNIIPEKVDTDSQVGVVEQLIVQPELSAVPTTEQVEGQAKVTASRTLPSIMVAMGGLVGAGQVIKTYVQRQHEKYKMLHRKSNHLYRRAVMAEYGQRDAIEDLQKVEEALFLLHQQTEILVKDFKNQITVIETAYQEKIGKVIDHQDVLRTTIADLKRLYELKQHDTDTLQEKYTSLCQRAAQDGRERSQQQENMQQAIDELETQLSGMNRKIMMYEELLVQAYKDTMKLKEERELQSQVETTVAFSQTEGEEQTIKIDSMLQTEPISMGSFALQTDEVMLQNNDTQTEQTLFAETAVQTEDLSEENRSYNFDLDQMKRTEVESGIEMKDTSVQSDNGNKTQDFSMQVGHGNGSSTRTIQTQTMPWITTTSSSLQQARDAFRGVVRTIENNGDGHQKRHFEGAHNSSLYTGSLVPRSARGK